MTPVAYGACSPSAGPRSCSPPSATVPAAGGSSLNVEAADLHPAYQHPTRDRRCPVGGSASIAACPPSSSPPPPTAPKSPVSPMLPKHWPPDQTATTLAKSLSRKKKGSHNRRDAAVRLARHHHHVANIRRHFVHQVSNALVKTHDRLVIEDLNVSGLLANHRLSRAISDASWSEFARLVRYKQALARRPAPRSQPLVSLQQAVSPMRDHRPELTLADRIFTCECGYSADRDANAR